MNLKLITVTIALLFFCFTVNAQTKIDRKQLVQRHTVKLNKADTLASLSVGNGSFAFTVDVTGLQSFPDEYAKGVPLGTQSAWGWHAFPNVHNYKFEDALRVYHLNGRDVSYAVQNGSGPEINKKTADYFRENEHRLHLANIGLEITKNNGSLASLADIKNIQQSLDMWDGSISSSFTVEGVPVKVITYGHQQQDAIAVKINSPLMLKGRISIRVRLPYPTGSWDDRGNNWTSENKHQSTIVNKQANASTIKHVLDTTHYFIQSLWSSKATFKEKQPHYFLITPTNTNDFEYSCSFSAQEKKTTAPSFTATKTSSTKGWFEFWNSGGAIDFAGSTDSRANELERRIILSQYLTRIQCADDFPPQETGLTYNSWYGKPHLEMHWWHGIHFALWGRPELLQKSVDWYLKVADVAKGIAQRQGYEGLRWQKMTDNEGREVPSSIGAFLIWQQPHFIYFTELLYRANNSKAILNKYKDLVFGTADFMASFARYDSVTHKYILGKGLIPAQERFNAEETFNPTYELVYWHWALNVAQQWRKRLGLKRNEKWDAVLKDLSPLPKQKDKYLFAESATDSYTNPEYKTDHPSVFGAFGMMPKTSMLDEHIMKNTFNWIWNNWSWHDTWGWDFPMTAMTATRLGLPDKAIDALLMDIQTNTYLPNGHNYQEGRLTIYLPGNGGLLAAVAMMCAGYDQANHKLPGIPKNGKWKVKTEGLQKMP
ncbi:hypothetical protein [Niabella ginsengisoli]|uniref:Glycoside hydrolase family 65 n=1 Tax=Niabella ginsengisoli TaxID=522298 RepID=A0ABS9SG79_9BACT|nr:hypothetical protein [Niabella ginsengisoli]MCH5597361.1 hypothetical protein [Niabella ginsengisoli]